MLVAVPTMAGGGGQGENLVSSHGTGHGRGPRGTGGSKLAARTPGTAGKYGKAMAQGTYEGGEALAVAGPRRWRRGWRGKPARSRRPISAGAREFLCGGASFVASADYGVDEFSWFFGIIYGSLF